MEPRRLGRSGLEVSPIALGTMMFGAWGNTDEAECRRMVDTALDAGITLLDTADIYDDGTSERILGAALHGKRDGVVLATKVGNEMGGDPDRRGLSRRWITAACEDSLRRLQVDHIDLYQMHRPDPDVPIGETIEVFDELVAAGKIGAYGTSTFSAVQLREVVDTATALGGALPTSEQPPYSALARGIERDVLEVCRAEDVGVIVWAPLNGGWLTGKYQHDAGDPDNRANRQGDHFDFKDEAMRVEKLRAVDAPDDDRRRPRPHDQAAGAGVRPRRPGDQRGDHRPAHPRSAHRPARRRRPRAALRGPRRHRRGGDPGPQHQPLRRRLSGPGFVQMRSEAPGRGWRSRSSRRGACR